MALHPARIAVQRLKRLAGRLLYAAAHTAEGFFDSRITSPEPLIPDEQLPCYLAAADVVFIQRTDILNSGNVPLALSFGRVVTGPDSGNIGGLLAETGNPAFDPADPRSVDIALERAARLSATDQGRPQPRLCAGTLRHRTHRRNVRRALRTTL